MKNLSSQNIQEEKYFITSLRKNFQDKKKIFHPEEKVFYQQSSIVERDFHWRIEREKKISSLDFKSPFNVTLEAKYQKKFSTKSFFIIAHFLSPPLFYQKSKKIQAIPPLGKKEIELYWKNLYLPQKSYSILGIYSPSGWENHLLENPPSLPLCSLILIYKNHLGWQFLSPETKLSSEILLLYNLDSYKTKKERVQNLVAKNLSQKSDYIPIEKIVKELSIPDSIFEKLIEEILVDNPDLVREFFQGTEILRYSQLGGTTMFFRKRKANSKEENFNNKTMSMLQKLDQLLAHNKIQLQKLQEEILVLENQEQREVEKIKEGHLSTREESFSLQDVKRLRKQIQNLEQRASIHDKNIDHNLNMISRVQDIEAMQMQGVEESEVDEVAYLFEKEMDDFQKKISAFKLVEVKESVLSLEDKSELENLKEEIISNSKKQTLKKKESKTVQEENSSSKTSFEIQ